MKQRTTWGTSERQTLVRQVLSEYDGSWLAAFAAHPDWRRILNYDDPNGKKNCYNTLGRYRSKTPDPTLGRAPAASFWTPERDDIVLRLVKEYNANYEEAFRAHPDWRTKLDCDNPVRKGRLYARVSAARKGILPRFRKDPPSHRHSTADGSAGLDDTLLRRIITEYVTPQGTLSLRVAFAEHPEWKQALGADDILGQRRVYGRIKTLRDRIAKAELNGTPANGAPEPLAVAELASVLPSPQAPDLSDMLHQCPQCGFDLLTFRRAFKTAFNTAFNIAKRNSR